MARPALPDQPLTASVYLRRLGRTWKNEKLTSKELASMPADDIDSPIMGFIEGQEKGGAAHSQ